MVEGVKEVKKPSKPPEIYENGALMAGFPHFPLKTIKT
jgi:hypothetical protein